MVSGYTITDDQIRELEVEAERLDDPEFVKVCRRAYRHGGRGTGSPQERAYLAATLNERAQWIADGQRRKDAEAL